MSAPTPSGPLFQTALYPLVSATPAGRVVRFLLKAGYDVRLPGGLVSRRLGTVLLDLNTPLAVVPDASHIQRHIVTTPAPPGWASRRIGWHGVPTPVASVQLFFRNDSTGAVEPFNVLALTPVATTPRQPQFIRLGQAFLAHFVLSVHIDFDAIQPGPPMSQSNSFINLNEPCGHIASR